MSGKLIAILALFVLCLFAQALFAEATAVFSDDFSSGSFAGWSAVSVSSSSGQLVSGGVARFVVPMPAAGSLTFSFVRKDGFTSTVNSVITAEEDVFVVNVPYGCQQGSGAIFFLYICDSSDLSGSRGNFGVGIDGSNVWSLWIGGNLTYRYVFQTSGVTPASNTWYHIVLTVDNPTGTVALAVNGLTIISVAQQEFTDKTHPISLMAGMGEDWWSAGPAQQEVDVDNVRLDVSDAPLPTPGPQNPTPISTPTPPTPTAAPTTTSPSNDPTATPQTTPEPTQTGTATPTDPNATAKPPTLPPPSASPPTPNPSQSSTAVLSAPTEFPLWVILPMVLAMATFFAVVLLLKKSKFGG